MQGERPFPIKPKENLTWLMFQANAKFYTQLSTPGQVGEESSGDQVKRILFCSVSSYSVCQVDGSGDCGDDMLKELYPDDDIPDDLIGFLDDKVSFFLSEKTGVGVISHFHTSDLELGPKRKEGQRGILVWKVAKKGSQFISDKSH